MWKRTIPRSLTILAAILGLLYQGAIAFLPPGLGAGILLASLAAGVAGLLVGLLLFSLGALGGGDAKLISALGFILGWSLWVRSMTIAILCAGAIGLLRAVISGRLLELLRNMRELAGWIHRERRAHPMLNIQNSSAIRSPFAVALAIGVLWVLWAG